MLTLERVADGGLVKSLDFAGKYFITLKLGGPGWTSSGLLLRKIS